MATEPKKNELLAYGYIRDIDNQNLLQQVIPSSIATIIMMFYPWIEEFKWDKINHGKNAKIIDDNTIRTVTKGTWAICISPHVISSDICDWYEWECKLNDWASRAVLEVGFIDSNLKKSIPNYDEPMGSNIKNEQYSFNICSLNYFRLYGKGHSSTTVKMHDTNKRAVSIPKKGDTFRVRIDFKSKNMKLWYNDEYINSAYQDIISESVVAAASIYDGSLTVTKTDYT